ncbi:hypothetical protein B0H17DRAFT_1177516 [Mycena rosella]|uniref:Uncharacterized protein n=1 Tax=Mycena rosella TaxID=1033263 RepID=A0AAD7DRP2_MYCRO|nr:hypothetical protein B0H17DRAFT_1177516 [Mycena rosella]
MSAVIPSAAAGLSLSASKPLMEELRDGSRAHPLPPPPQRQALADGIRALRAHPRAHASDGARLKVRPRQARGVRARCQITRPGRGGAGEERALEKALTDWVRARFEAEQARVDDLSAAGMVERYIISCSICAAAVEGQGPAAALALIRARIGSKRISLRASGSAITFAEGGLALIPGSPLHSFPASRCTPRGSVDRHRCTVPACARVRGLYPSLVLRFFLLLCFPLSSLHIRALGGSFALFSACPDARWIITDARCLYSRRAGPVSLHGALSLAVTRQRSKRFVMGSPYASPQVALTFLSSDGFIREPHRLLSFLFSFFAFFSVSWSSPFGLGGSTSLTRLVVRYSSANAGRAVFVRAGFVQGLRLTRSFHSFSASRPS